MNNNYFYRIDPDMVDELVDFLCKHVHDDKKDARETIYLALSSTRDSTCVRFLSNEYNYASSDYYIKSGYTEYDWKAELNKDQQVDYNKRIKELKEEIEKLEKERDETPERAVGSYYVRGYHAVGMDINISNHSLRYKSGNSYTKKEYAEHAAKHIARVHAMVQAMIAIEGEVIYPKDNSSQWVFSFMPCGGIRYTSIYSYVNKSHDPALFTSEENAKKAIEFIKREFPEVLE